jgi:Protein of unknown function (DUF3750)
MMRAAIRMTGSLLCALLVAMLLATAGLLSAQDWRTASREPVGLAPDPANTPEPVVQVYAARAVGWRGLFGVHTWIAVKPAGQGYTVYEVIGWRLYSSDSAVVIRNRPPDGRWFGAEPELLAESRGADVSAVIARIEKAARDYPWSGEYKLWPGPNSNTFTAWILRAVPELRVDLPPTAIGKDYSGDRVFTSAPSGNGVQCRFSACWG